MARPEQIVPAFKARAAQTAADAAKAKKPRRGKRKALVDQLKQVKGAAK